MILDIGPRTISQAVGLLASARTLVWNGPVGAFEIAPSQTGTMTIAKVAAQLTKVGALETIAWRRRHDRGAQSSRCYPGLHLCLDGRRRLSRMARRQKIAARRSAPMDRCADRVRFALKWPRFAGPFHRPGSLS